MSLNYTEQIKKLLEGKKQALITFRADGQGDAIGSSVALALFLEKMGKQADVVAHNFKLPHAFSFLKKANSIKNSFPHLQKFVITVDVEKTGVQELSYDIKDEKLRLFITPKAGFLTRDSIRTAQSDFRYDIIFVLDTADLQALGPLYDSNTELFYSKPVINIDHNPSNEHFGQVNLIDTTAASVGEILSNLMHDWQPELIDGGIATGLLTAVIANTRSFKANNIKPHTLFIASKLMQLGADRENIVQNLYRTRSISTLKLWGQALAHLQYDQSVGLVWTTITHSEFAHSGANAGELYEIVDELISNSPEAKLILLFHEQKTTTEPSSVHVILDTSREYNAAELLKPYQPINADKKQATAIVMGKSLKEVEEEVITQIKKTVV